MNCKVIDEGGVDVEKVLSEGEKEVVESKKRGRKKKIKVEEEEDIKTKKKRGRKATLKFFSSTIRKNMPLTANINDNDKSILHLNIEDDIIDVKKELTYDVIKNEYINSVPIIDKEGNLRWESNKEEIYTLPDKEELDYIEQLNENKLDVEDLYEKQLLIRSKQDDNLIKRLEHLNKNDILIDELMNSKKIESTKIKNNLNIYKGFYPILKEFLEQDEWLDTTDICCWWCCHKFTTIPIGIPHEYNTKNNKFRVKGVFCSFACVCSYNKEVYSNNLKIDSLIKYMYKKMTGGLIQSKKLLHTHQYSDEYIKALDSFIDSSLECAPSRYTLKMFGGNLTIEEFRNSVKERKIYNMIEYPLYISRDYIEEVDLQKVKDLNTSLFNKKTIYVNNEKQIQEAKIRDNKNIVVTNNGIDKFIK